MEKLINQINAHGYAVHLREYNALTVAGEARWEAIATSRKNNNGKHIHMDEIVFGRDPVHALTKLSAKVTAAVQSKAAAVKDPFDDEAEEDPFGVEQDEAFA